VTATFKANVAPCTEKLTHRACIWPFSTDIIFEVDQQPHEDHIQLIVELEIPEWCPSTRQCLEDMSLGEAMEYLQNVATEACKDEDDQVNEEVVAGDTEADEEDDAFHLSNYSDLVSSLKTSGLTEKDKMRRVMQKLDRHAYLPNIRAVMLAAGVNEGTMRGMAGPSKAKDNGWIVGGDGLYALPVSTRSDGASGKRELSEAATDPTPVKKKQIRASSDVSANDSSDALANRLKNSSNGDFKAILDEASSRALACLDREVNAKTITFLRRNPCATHGAMQEFRADEMAKAQGGILEAVKLLKAYL